LATRETQSAQKLRLLLATRDTQSALLQNSIEALSTVQFFKSASTTHTLRIWYLVFGIWYLVFGIWYSVFGIWYLVFGIWYLVFGIWHLVFGIWYWPLATGDTQTV
jgi:hypothetical protein